MNFKNKLLLVYFYKFWICQKLNRDEIYEKIIPKYAKFVAKLTATKLLNRYTLKSEKICVYQNLIIITFDNN